MEGEGVSGVLAEEVPGPATIPNEHIDFIRRISSDHPEYGEDRIALELEVKFGIATPARRSGDTWSRGVRDREIPKPGEAF